MRSIKFMAATYLVAAFVTLQAEQKSEEQLRAACGQPQAAAAAFHEYGVFLRDSGRYEEAVEQFMRSTDLAPRNIDMFMAWAYLYVMIGDKENALRVYHRMLEILPNNATLLYNCGYVAKECNDPELALDYYFKALKVNPENDTTHFAIARTYIQMGQLQEGWRWYERYLRSSGRNADALRALLAQDALAGKTVLLLQEGSFGDVIQFIRYGQVLKDKGAYVIACVQKPLLSVLSRCTCIDKICAVGSPVPYHDATVHMMSAPAILQDSLETVPHEVPYVFPQPALRAQWQEKLTTDSTVKVGLCWQADVFNDSSRMPVARRGIPLAKLMKLQSIPGVSLYSLQQKDGVEQLEEVKGAMNIQVFDADFDGSHGRFEDTAAVMSNLDLIISVDTAIPHLAGALGRPVWIMLPYSTDWRWLFGRSDSPWYPTMKIVQQPAPFDWDSVVDKVYAMLVDFVAQKKS